MEELIAKCGCNCSNCPTYKENLKSIENRYQCSIGWEKYLNIKLKPEKLRLCDGCFIPDEDRKTYYLNCRVRKCAIFNGAPNCAHCSAYPCQDVRTVHSIQESETRQTIEKRIGYKIPDKDYLEIIEPYEGIKHLNKIRESLKPEDIVEMIPVSINPKTIPFPMGFPIKSKEEFSYQEIHRIICSIEVEDNISYARSIELDKNRKLLLKLLWTFGSIGELSKDKEAIILGSKEYSDQKLTSYHSRLCELIKILEKSRLRCEFVPIKNSEWRTKTGALRKDGWNLKLSFMKKENQEFLHTLKRYTELLIKKYDQNAFRYFAKADMRAVCQENC
jgi:hypothetical protein